MVAISGCEAELFNSLFVREVLDLKAGFGRRLDYSEVGFSKD